MVVDRLGRISIIVDSDYHPRLGIEDLEKRTTIHPRLEAGHGGAEQGGVSLT